MAELVNLLKPYLSASCGVLADALMSLVMIHAKTCHADPFLLSHDCQVKAEVVPFNRMRMVDKWIGE